MPDIDELRKAAFDTRPRCEHIMDRADDHTVLCALHQGHAGSHSRVDPRTQAQNELAEIEYDQRVAEAAEANGNS